MKSVPASRSRSIRTRLTPWKDCSHLSLSGCYSEKSSTVSASMKRSITRWKYDAVTGNARPATRPQHHDPKRRTKLRYVRAPTAERLREKLTPYSRVHSGCLFTQKRVGFCVHLVLLSAPKSCRMSFV